MLEEFINLMISQFVPVNFKLDTFPPCQCSKVFSCQFQCSILTKSNLQDPELRNCSRHAYTYNYTWIFTLFRIILACVASASISLEININLALSLLEINILSNISINVLPIDLETTTCSFPYKRMHQLIGWILFCRKQHSHAEH